MVSVKEFQTPPASYRIKPFWFWNGEMTKEEIRYQIKEMAEKGLGGMFICARQGMTVPYLSEEWFELVKYACKEAENQGLEAWLYDEYPYPSGMSGGEVLLEHPEAEHMVLHHKRLDVSGGEMVEQDLGWNRILFARAYPVNQKGQTDWNNELNLESWVGNLQMEKIYQQTGLTKYNNKRFFTYGPSKILKGRLPELEEGSWRIEIYSEGKLGDFKYYGGFFDPCNKEAVQTFLDTTHERYKRAVGEQFGITVHGMFSDEVGLLSPIPWSKLLPKEFEKRHGYSILECLPALHDRTVEHALKIRYDLYETAHELFRSSYHKQVADWCRENKLLYATEVPSMRHSTQRFSDIPGGDTAHEKLGKSLEWIYDEYLPNYRSNAKAVSSLARQLGKKYAMIESFHSVGWTMTLQDAKWMIDRLGSSGINLYNFHAFYYTIQDITKHDAPPSQFLQNPYWKYYRKLADYVGRMGVMITGTEAETEIAVLDPVASLWTSLGDPFHGFSYQGESEEERILCDTIRNQWVEICKTILFHQMDYDHLDGELLREAEIRDGKILLGKAAYSVVLVPPCLCMEAATRERLIEFASQGGCVIGIEQLPEYSVDKEETDQETVDAWNHLFEMDSAVFMPELQKDELIRLCRKYTSESAVWKVIKGNPRQVIGCIRRDEDGNIYAFLANQGKDFVTAELAYKKDERMKVFLYDLETGEIQNICKEDEKIILHLEGFESRWIQIKKDYDSSGNNEQSLSGKTKIWIPAEGQWNVEPDRKNICRFGNVEISLDKEDWKKAEVKTFIEQCDELKILKKENICFQGDFGTPKKIRPKYPLVCSYRISFEAEWIPDDLCLFMDKETISGDCRIQINGILLEQNRWESIRVNDQNNQQIFIGDLVQIGKNEIIFEVLIEKDEDGLRDPVYLRGAFGVEECDGILRLIEQPKRGTPDGYWCQGFPFFSGTITYKKVMKKEALGINGNNKEDDIFAVRLKQNVPSYDCIRLSINGVDLGVKAYAPYQWDCPARFLKEENEIQIAITNTLANMLDGTYFDYEKHQLIPVLSGKGEKA